MKTNFLHALRTANGLGYWILWRISERGIRPRRKLAAIKRHQRSFDKMAEKYWGVDRKKYDIIIYLKTIHESLLEQKLNN